MHIATWKLNLTQSSILIMLQIKQFHPINITDAARKGTGLRTVVVQSLRGSERSFKNPALVVEIHSSAQISSLPLSQSLLLIEGFDDDAKIRVRNPRSPGWNVILLHPVKLKNINILARGL